MLPTMILPELIRASPLRRHAEIDRLARLLRAASREQAMTDFKAAWERAP